MYSVAPNDLGEALVDAAQGKEIAAYKIRNLDLNLNELVATSPENVQKWSGIGNAPVFQSSLNNQTPSGASSFSNHGLDDADEMYFVEGKHVIHVALSDGMDITWPFGTSILDPVFKTFKQKELLEDAIIIYRIQRAPERRVFYIDVGDMPPHLAMRHVERVKNEIHQRRVPTQAGGGTTMMDAQYNPLCLAMDTEIPLLDGRTLTIEQLADEYRDGKENWTYSCDPVTGKIVPGNITWAGVTRKNAQVLKLHLDNGSSVTLTPDHKVPVLGRGFVEAQNLTENDSLISFDIREQSLSSSSSDRTYTQVYDHELNEYVFAHRMVGNFFRNIGKHREFTYLPENKGAWKSVVHHGDFNRYNNDPRNLQWMNKDDHCRFHQDQNMWQHLGEEEFFDENPNFVNDVLMPNLKKWNESYPNQKKTYEFDQLQALHNLATKHDFNMKNMLKDEKNHDDFIETVKKSNQPEHGDNFRMQTDKLTVQVVCNTIRHFG